MIAVQTYKQTSRASEPRSEQKKQYNKSYKHKYKRKDCLNLEEASMKVRGKKGRKKKEAFTFNTGKSGREEAKCTWLSESRE